MLGARVAPVGCPADLREVPAVIDADPVLAEGADYPGGAKRCRSALLAWCVRPALVGTPIIARRCIERPLTRLRSWSSGIIGSPYSTDRARHC